MKRIDNLNNTLEKEDIIAVKRFLHRVGRNSFPIILSIALGVSTAFVITKFTHPTWESKVLMLVKDQLPKETVMDNVSTGEIARRNNLKNNIGIITSYSLNKQVLDNLDRAVTWFESRLFSDRELYKKEPFAVTTVRDGMNLYNIPIHISFIDSTQYRITINHLFNDTGKKKHVEISEIHQFGEPFIHDFFNFTVWMKNNGRPTEGNFYFVFNNLRNMVMAYSSRLSVIPGETNSDLISIMLRDTDPEKTSDYLNELSKVFIQFGLMEQNRESANTVRFIDNQLSGVSDTLTETGRNFTNFRSRNQIINIGQEGDLIVQKLEQLKTERSDEAMRLEYYESLYNYLDYKGELKQPISPSVAGIADATVTNLVNRLTEVYSRKEKISFSVQDKNPTMVLINNEIDLIARTLKENLSGLVNNSKIAVSNLDRRIISMEAQLQAYPKTEQELMDIKRSFDLNNDLYTYLLKRRAEAAIRHASNVPQVQILDQAEASTAIRVGPRMSINLVLGGMAGLAIPIIILIIGSYFNDRVHSAEDIEKLSSIQVAGNVVNNIHKKEFLPAVRYPRSAFAESLRELRTSIRFLFPGEKLNVISINSVIPKEGKSFIALNLASIIAINNTKVMLIDCDLRKPGIHKPLGCKNHKGLSSYLLFDAEKEDIIQSTKIENLFFIAAGPIPASPSEILETGRLETLLDELREEFDCIIIDNAPLSLVSDAIITSQFADLNLFVLKQDYSKKNEIRFINHMNANKTMQKAGIILNGINTRKHAQAGYYGARYSYKHSYGYNYYLENN